MENNETEKLLDTMLEEQCKQLAMDQEMADKETKKKTIDVLRKFLSYIKSSKFNGKCKELSKKYNCNYKLVKNHFVASILRKIGDILHLTITITSEIIKHAIDFITAIINKVTDFCYNVCVSIINLLTLNCGSYINTEGDCK